jgi:hypothetical protein
MRSSVTTWPWPVSRSMASDSPSGDNEIWLKPGVCPKAEAGGGPASAVLQASVHAASTASHPG